MLRALSLDDDWLELSIDVAPTRIIGVGDTVDDLIGPMVNHEVIVRAKLAKRHQLVFVDIEQEE